MAGKGLWIKTAVCSAAFLTLTVPGPEATPIAAGANVLVAPDATVPAAGIAFPGGTELDSLCYANLASGNLIVDVATAVVSNGGFLDFYYQVRNDSALNELHRVTASDFSGFISDVWFVTNGSAVPCAACPGGFMVDGTQDPLTFDRDAAGEVVGFNFPSPGFVVDPGETSLVLLIQTNATAYEPGLVSVINSGSATQPAFQPSTASPRTKKATNRNRCR